jgi:hypothetical protein
MLSISIDCVSHRHHIKTPEFEASRDGHGCSCPTHLHIDN